MENHLSDREQMTGSRTEHFLVDNNKSKMYFRTVYVIGCLFLMKNY